MQGVICQIRLGADFVVEPNVCSVCTDRLSATPMFNWSWANGWFSW